VDGPALTPSQIVQRSGGDAERVTKNLEQLIREGFIVKQRGRYRIA
jgi:DNA-binding MarR family transcriptional regulator